ncbi:hypothetical protein HOO68_04905 [Candidatus Gracilibacteria bacterium]|nr:hypothetical protein [Candidatus Gracilibacteria bacterium]
MSIYTIWGNTISINFSLPIEETGFIGEDFDYKKKHAYATIGIQEIIKHDTTISLQLILGTIFQAFYHKAQESKLDYLQTLTINDTEVWIIDNGDTICIMKKEEY